MTIMACPQTECANRSYVRIDGDQIAWRSRRAGGENMDICIRNDGHQEAVNLQSTHRTRTSKCWHSCSSILLRG